MKKNVFALACFALLHVVDARAGITLTALPGSTPQHARGGATFANPIGVIAIDELGRPVPDIGVNFSIGTGVEDVCGLLPAPLPSVGSTPVRATSTSIDGTARTCPLVASLEPGRAIVTAQSPSAANVVTFELWSDGNPAVKVEVVSGDGQTVQVDAIYALPWIVKAVDAAGVPVPGAKIDWHSPLYPNLPGFFFPRDLTLFAGADGIVAVSPRANSVSGPGYARITLPGSAASASMGFTNVGGSVHGSVPSGGDSLVIEALPESAHLVVQPGADFPTIGVRVTLDGKPVEGASVSFGYVTSTVTSAVGWFADTDANGIAAPRVPGKMPNFPSPLVVTASTQVWTESTKVSTSIPIAIGGPIIVTPLPGSTPQHARSGTVFPNPIGVLATNTSGQPVSGFPLLFSVPSLSTPVGVICTSTPNPRAVGLSFTTQTDASGVGLFLPPNCFFIAAEVPGTYTFGGGINSTFTLVNDGNPPVAVEIVSGDNQVVPPNSPMQPWVVRALDAAGRPVPYAAVFWSGALNNTLPDFGVPGVAYNIPSGSLIAPTFADANGIASISLRSQSGIGTGTRTAGVFTLGTLPATFHFTVGTAVAPPPAPQVQDLWWGGLAENGWGVSIAQHGDNLFNVIYGYGNSGEPLWLVQSSGSWNFDRSTWTGPVYAPRGAPFFAYDPNALLVGSALGTASLTFFDTEHAMLDVELNGVSLKRGLTRTVFTGASNAAPTNLGDLWWGGAAQNGWGMSFAQHGSALFGAWYTYGADGFDTWFVMPSGTWTSATTYEGRLYRTHGAPLFTTAAYDASKLQVTDVGAFKLTFSGDTARFDWSVDGRTGTQAITRNAF